jgi:serine/threonine-protein kinase
MLVPDQELPEGERAKILDFGIAKLTGGDAGGSAALKVKTKTGALLGTPVYMSPEQCRGIGTIDDRTDVYALGVMLFEMLAGEPPFLSEGLGELVGMHMFKPAPDLAQRAPETPPELVQLVKRMLAKNQAERPSMAETAVTLKRLGHGVSSSGLHIPTAGGKAQDVRLDAPPPITTIGHSAGQHTTALSRSRGWIAVAAVGALVLGGSAGALWSLRRVWRHPTVFVQTAAIPALVAPPAASPPPPTPAPAASVSPPVVAAANERPAAVNQAALCQTLFKRGRFSDAITACKAALTSNPEQSEVQRTLRAAKAAVASAAHAPPAKSANSPPSAAAAPPPHDYKKVKPLD